MCDLDTSLDGLLLHSDTLCVLSYDGPDDPYEDLQGSVEDGQEERQEEEEAAEQRYYRHHGRYYRWAPDLDTPAAEDAGSGTTAATGGTTASARTGTTAGDTAPTTGKPQSATGSSTVLAGCQTSTTASIVDN